MKSQLEKLIILALRKIRFMIMKGNYYMSFLLVLFFVSIACARTEIKITLEGTVNGLKKEVPIRVYSFEKAKELASSKISESGNFKMEFSANPGIYRLVFGEYKKEQSLEIIVTGSQQHIKFSIDLSANIKKPEFSRSKINQDWYDYKQRESAYSFKIDLIHQFLSYYPDKFDRLYQEAQKGLFAVRSDMQKYREDFIESHTGYAGKMVKNTPPWFSVNPSKAGIDKNKEHIESYWKQPIEDRDKTMLNTPLYVNHTISYINLYMRSYGQEEGEQKIKDAIDLLVGKFGKEYEIKKQILNALVQKFKTGGTVMEPLLQYVDEKYLDASMLVDENEVKEYAIRLATYRDLKKGEIPPMVYYMDGDKKVPFTDIKSKYLFLVFWESTCSHCREQMPKFNDFLNTHPQYKAIAVSMDENKNSYTRFLPRIDNMYKYCDFKGGESKVIQNYYITSTPTFFLLDKDKRLIKKYYSVQNIKYDIKQGNL